MEVPSIISEEERYDYWALFREYDTANAGFITRAQVDPTFTSSGLSSDQLAQIWGLAAMTQDHMLNFREFVIANYLISIAQQGHELPQSLPQSLIDAIGPIKAPAISWDISLRELDKYLAVFNKTVSDGFLTGTQARTLFTRSGLPMVELGRIWTLADMNVRGKLNIIEFNIAMYLIDIRLRGHPIPTALPHRLFISASYGYLHA